MRDGAEHEAKEPGNEKGLAKNIGNYRPMISKNSNEILVSLPLVLFNIYWQTMILIIEVAKCIIRLNSNRECKTWNRRS